LWIQGSSQNNNNTEAQPPPAKKHKRAHAADGASFITSSPQKVKKVTQVHTGKVANPTPNLFRNRRAIINPFD